MDDKDKEPAMARGRSEPYDAKADKAYEQRRAGLLPPDSAADRVVIAGRKAKAEAQAAARADVAAAREAR